jgi:hypothetical protein
MDNENIKKEDLFDAIKYGYIWHAQKIKDELGKLIDMNSVASNHDFRFDSEDKYYYVYDNECHLFIFDGRIELRSDRDNVFSSDMTFTHEIKSAKDIQTAYHQFNSITMEGEEDD